MSENGESGYRPDIKNNTPSVDGKKIIETLSNSGLESRCIKTNVNDFPEVIVIKREEVPQEKTIRIYRGFNKTGKEMLNQAPYAMRLVDQYGDLTIADDMEGVVDDLAEKPTYEKLINYAELMAPKQDQHQRQYFKESLERIEKYMLSDNNEYGIARHLMFENVGHVGGIAAEPGITPYLSATLVPTEALGYTKMHGALIVADMPISKLDFLSDSTKGEIFIKGMLDKKYIRAIIPKNTNEDVNIYKDSLDVALKVAANEVEGEVYSQDELPTLLTHETQKRREEEKAQNKIDLKVLQQKKATQLFRSYSSREPELQKIFENKELTDSDVDTDIYSQTKNTIFDYYVNKLERMVESMDYWEKKFDKEKVDEKMLFELKDVVEEQEEVMARRERRRQERIKNNFRI